MKNILEAKNIYKGYGDVNVLSNINISLTSNQITAIVGSSGAGKTTLLHILGTLDKPTKKMNSSLIINQTDVFSLNDKELSLFRNKSLGFIFQFHELLPEFSALENVCIPQWIANKNVDESNEKAIKILSNLGLKKRLNHKPSQLSGGEQQRVAVARALINEPKIIFADEPSGNLDSDNAKNLHDLFYDLRDESSCSFVIVTHNETLANRADQKILLKDGQVLR
jgi:lipoprotein-releasing system ATP-binding protein